MSQGQRMTPPPENVSDEPLGFFEYELTDELAFQAALAHFELQARQVKEDIVRQGGLHPALPIVLASLMLLIGLVLAWFVAWDFFPTPYLFVLGCVVQLLLLFKAALYFHPPFVRWYIHFQSRRSLRRLSPRTIRWTIYEDRLETKSAASHRNLAWSRLTRLDDLPDFWWLHWRGGPPLMAPVAAMPAELQDVIRSKARRDPGPGAPNPNLYA
jgi:hypothetical protein